MRQRRSEPPLLTELALRPLACCCAAFALAVYLSVYLLRGWQMLLGGGALLLLGLVLPLRGHRRAGAMLLAGMLGLWLSWLWCYQITDLESNMAGQTLPLTMQARDYASPARYGAEVEVKVTSPGPLQGRRMTLYVDQRDLSAAPGDVLSGEVKLKSARGQGKWELYSFASGILMKGSTRFVQVSPAQHVPLSLLPAAAAHALGDALDKLFPAQEAGFLLALTTGNKGKLSPGLKETLSDTGLSHIVAASGLHVSVLVTAVFLLPGSRRRRSLILLPLMGFYAALAGFSPSICRAVLMEGILLMAPVLGREEDGVTSLTLALALILMHNPLSAASVSLQLSFAAMLGLLLITPQLMSMFELPETPGRRARRLLIAGPAMTFGANFFTLPLVLCWFGNASGLSPLSNLVVLWLLPILLPLALVTAAVGAVSLPLGAALAKVTALPAGLAIRLICGLGRLPRLAISMGWQSWVWIIALWAVTCLALFARPPRWSVRLMIGALAAGLVLLVLPVSDQDAPVRIDVLDVGQGQCILLRSEGQTAVIDCGSLQNRAGPVLTNALRRRGITRVDLLLLTHYDSDHTNGVEELLEQCAVDTVLMPEAVEEDEERARGLTLKLRTAGAKPVSVTEQITELQLGLLTLHITMVGEDDEHMAVALCSAGDFDFLVTGDADMDGEAELLQRLAPPDIEVLVGGHHGSKYATGTELLQRTRPDTVLFSVGSNSYGHPTQEALSRCRDAGAEIRRTDQQGSITVLAQEDGSFQIVLAK